MHIDSKEVVASVPILEVRRFLREYEIFDLSDICWRLQLKKTAAKQLLAELTRRGWAHPPQSESDIRYGNYRKSPTGQRFCLASAGRPLTRERAEALLESAISRANEVNSDPRYAYYVKTIRLFGSMLTNKERPSDVDLDVELARRYDDQEIDDLVRKERCKNAPERSNIVIRIYWPQIEIYRKLKNRSSGLSIQEHQSLEISAEEDFKVVFQAGVVSRLSNRQIKARSRRGRI